VDLERRYRNIRNELMNEYHFPIVCGRWDNGGIIFMHEFMHVCNNVCISLYMYVGVHALVVWSKKTKFKQETKTPLGLLDL